MTYATRQDLIDRYTESELARLTDQVSATVIDDAVVGRALADSDAEIDGYVSARYATPLSPPPALIVQLACAIARFRLWADTATSRVRQDYEDAIARLKAISAGDMALPGATPAGSDSAIPGAAPSFEADARVFDDASLRGYQ